MHHAGLTAQKDRIALNNVQSHEKELQHAYDVSKLARSQCENSLHEGREDLQACQEEQTQERKQYEETEKKLNCIWKANSRLEKIVSSIHCKIDFNETSGSYTLNVSDLVLESEAKVLQISELESAIKEGRQKRENSENKTIKDLDNSPR